MKKHQILAFLAIFLFAFSSYVSAQATIKWDDESDFEDGVMEEEFIQEDTAFLIVRKSTKEMKLVIGRNYDVEIELYNAGTSSAASVNVADEAWDPEYFQTENETINCDFERIMAGSSAKCTYQITPIKHGVYLPDPATVSYFNTPDSTDPKLSYSSRNYVMVVTLDQHYLYKALYYGSYISLGSLLSIYDWLIFFIVVLAIGGYVVGKRLHASYQVRRKNALYQKSLEEVNKMK